MLKSQQQNKQTLVHLMIQINFVRFVFASAEVHQLDPLSALYATVTCGLSPAHLTLRLIHQLLHEDKNCIQTLKLMWLYREVNLHVTAIRPMVWVLSSSDLQQREERQASRGKDKTSVGLCSLSQIQKSHKVAVFHPGQLNSPSSAHHSVQNPYLGSYHDISVIPLSHTQKQNIQKLFL